MTFPSMRQRNGCDSVETNAIRESDRTNTKALSQRHVIHVQLKLYLMRLESKFKINYLFGIMLIYRCVYWYPENVKFY